MSKIDTQYYINAVHSSIYNKTSLKESGIGRCFFCLHYSWYENIIEWADENQTAICPVCDIDSILPKHKAPIENMQFMFEMQSFWFGPDVNIRRFLSLIQDEKFKIRKVNT